MKVLDKLRVHVDKIKPVYRMDVAASWFSDPKYFPESAKATLHPLDRKEPPSGEGWIIQILCHHYNPQPTIEERKLPEAEQKAFGPYNYIVRKVLPRFQGVDDRLYGIHHAAVTWKQTDPKWTSEKGAVTATSLAANLLDRATAAVAAGGAGGMGGPGMEMGGNPGMMSQMAGQMGGKMGGGGMGGPGMMNRAGMMAEMGGMMMGGPMMGGATKKAPIQTQTRTDFLIQFVWQPPTADKPAKTAEEIRKLLTEAQNDPKNKEAIAAYDPVKIEKQLDEESTKASQAKTQEALKAQGTNGAIPGAPAGAPPAGPGATPAPSGNP